MTRAMCRASCPALVFVMLLASERGALATGRTFDPLPYASRASSPFDLAGGGFFLEDFEDGALDTPGVTAFGGRVIGPGGLTDSVDGDDGLVDGSGTDGHSFFSAAGRVRFVFDPSVLGGYPTAVGIVLTDRTGDVTLNWASAFSSLAGIFGGVGLEGTEPTAHGLCGQAGTDRFFSVYEPGGGIRAIEVVGQDGGPIEVDHLQYSAMALAPVVMRTSTTTTTLPARGCDLPADLLVARIEDACPCATARSRTAHLACAKRALRAGMRLGSVPKACRRLALPCMKQSTCGTRRAVTCCNAGGAPACRIARSEAACSARGGVPGPSGSCCTACAATPCSPGSGPAITATECRATKLDALGTLRACQARARADQVEGMAGDPASCRLVFGDTLAAVGYRAAAAGMACRFLDNGDRTITDLHEGFTWQQESTPDQTATWAEAMSDFVGGAVGTSSDGTHVSGCLAGRCDWRLPMVAPLWTLLKQSVYCTRCIDPIFSAQPGRYWTSTSLTSDQRLAWTVDFTQYRADPEPPSTAYSLRVVRGGLDDWPTTSPVDGGRCAATKLRALGDVRSCHATERVRALRSGEVADLAPCDAAFASALDAADTAGGAPCRYLDNGNDTVTDLHTGLTWERKSVTTAVHTEDWRGAMATFLAETNGSREAVFTIPQGLAGFDDWRLPTVAELGALLEAERQGCANGTAPCIDVAFGPTALAPPYWSSTALTGDSTQAWGVRFGDPSSGPVAMSKSAAGSVRAVRGGLD